MVGRISTQSQHQQIIKDINNSQTFLADLQRQISSGQRAETFPDLGSSISRTIDLESRIKSADRYQSGNNIVISRLKVMSGSVDSLVKVAQEFRNIVSQERGASGSIIDLTGTARAGLKKVADSLNASLNGRYLFAGGKTDSPPINLENIQLSNLEVDENNNPVGSDLYYDGDGEIFAVQATENLDIEYGVTGNNEAFRYLVAAIHMGIEAEEETGTAKDEKLGDAMTLINQAIDGLTQVNYTVNSNIVTLEDVNSIHAAAGVQLKDFLGKENDSDVVDASIRVSQGQATLTALLQTFARISQLSLTQFLR
jgi:flagellar hook-associated protein 3 FlgL